MSNPAYKTTDNFIETYRPFLEKLEREQQKEREFIVYHDNGQIKNIKPYRENNIKSEYASIVVLYQEVIDIILGKISLNNFHVKDGELVRKRETLNKEKLIGDTGDEFVQPVTHNPDAVLIFEVCPKTISVSIEKIHLNEYKRLLNSDLVSEKNLNIAGSKHLTFFVADNSDPNMLIDSFSLSVSELVKNGKVIVEGNFDWNEMSIYCQHFTELGLKEKDKQ